MKRKCHEIIWWSWKIISVSCI